MDKSGPETYLALMSPEQVLLASEVAALVGGAALLIVLWGGRAKGRLRCPTCWHRMEGIESLRCPECGCTAKSSRRLLKTRRRWWLGALGGCMTGVGIWIAMIADRAERDGWREAMPATVLLLMMTVTDSDWPEETLKSQVGYWPGEDSAATFSSQLWAWQWWWWRSLKHAIALDESRTMGVRLSAFSDIQDYGLYKDRTFDSVLDFIEAHPNEVEPDLFFILGYGPYEHRSNDPRLYDLLVSRVQSKTGDIGHAWFVLLRSRAHAADIRAMMHQELTSSDPERRRAVCDGLRFSDEVPIDPGLVDELVGLIRCCDDAGSSAVWALEERDRIDVLLPLLMDVVDDVSLEDISSTSDDGRQSFDRIEATKGLARWGKRAVAAIPCLLQHAGDPDERVRAGVIEALETIDVASPHVLRALRERIDDPEETSANIFLAMDALKSLKRSENNSVY